MRTIHSKIFFCTSSLVSIFLGLYFASFNYKVEAVANVVNISATQQGSGTFAGNVTGAVINGTTGINTGAGAGTSRISSAGNMTNIGTISSGAITATSFAGAGTSLTGTATSLNIGGNAATVTDGDYLSQAQSITGKKIFIGDMNKNVNDGSGTIELRSSGNVPVGLTFHRPGAFASKITLDTDNIFHFGGWSNSSDGGTVKAGGLIVQGIWPLTLQLDPLYYSPASPWNLGPTNSGSNNFVIRQSVSGQGMYLQSANGNAGWSSLSDERIKTNIHDLSGAKSLEAIIKIRPVTFNWIDSNSAKSLQSGFIAQEMQTILPDIVSVYGETKIALSNGSVQKIPNALGVSQAGLIPHLVKAIQEQQKQIDELKHAIAEIKN